MRLRRVTLQALSPAEKIKVIAVISLPSIPSLFRGMVTKGFKKDSPNMGVALDYDELASKQFGYDRLEAMPVVVVITKDSTEKFQGQVTNDELKARVVAQIKKDLKPAKAGINQSTKQ